MGRRCTRFGVSLATLVVSVLAVEGVTRSLGFDFDRLASGIEEIPTYYQRPRVPLDPVFFRRDGPREWSGRVLHARARQVLGKDVEHSLDDEEPVTLRYDAQGFRNPLDLEDWDIVCVGDSFTEQGTLPDDELFTTHLSAALGLRVKNLGVSFTGTLTHVAYLQAYGKSTSTQVAVLVFFEGNDVTDLMRERAALERFRATGEREYRELAVQHSFVEALCDSFERDSRRRELFDSAVFRHGGQETPVSVGYVPPNAAELSQEEATALAEALHEWGEAARGLGLQPWIVYMPCKHRVLYDGLVYGPAASAAVRTWTPSDLPSHVSVLAKADHMGFIDCTPALLEASSRGVLTFHAVFDGHLNREGSRIVGAVIAEALGAASRDV